MFLWRLSEEVDKIGKWTKENVCKVGWQAGRQTDKEELDWGMFSACPLTWLAFPLLSPTMESGFWSPFAIFGYKCNYVSKRN